MEMRAGAALRNEPVRQGKVPVGSARILLLGGGGVLGSHLARMLAGTAAHRGDPGRTRCRPAERHRAPAGRGGVVRRRIRGAGPGRRLRPRSGAGRAGTRQPAAGGGAGAADQCRWAVRRRVLSLVGGAGGRLHPRRGRLCRCRRQPRAYRGAASAGCGGAAGRGAGGDRRRPAARRVDGGGGRHQPRSQCHHRRAHLCLPEQPGTTWPRHPDDHAGRGRAAVPHAARRRLATGACVAGAVAYRPAGSFHRLQPGASFCSRCATPPTTICCRNAGPDCGMCG